MTVNVVAVAAVTRALLPALRAAHGLVITVNSGSGLTATPASGAYCASKFALRAFSDSLRQEEREHGVRVTSLHPGRVDTDMQHELVEFEGAEYDADAYLDVDSVVRAARLAVDAGPDASVDMVSVRPRGWRPRRLTPPAPDAARSSRPTRQHTEKVTTHRDRMPVCCDCSVCCEAGGGQMRLAPRVGTRASRAKASASARSTSRCSRPTLRVDTSTTTSPPQPLSARCSSTAPQGCGAAPRHEVLVEERAEPVGEVQVREPRAERPRHRERVGAGGRGVREVERHVVVGLGDRVPVREVGHDLAPRRAPGIHVLHREPDPRLVLTQRHPVDEPGGILPLPAEGRVQHDGAGADLEREVDGAVDLAPRVGAPARAGSAAGSARAPRRSAGRAAPTGPAGLPPPA